MSPVLLTHAEEALSAETPPVASSAASTAAAVHDRLPALALILCPVHLSKAPEARQSRVVGEVSQGQSSRASISGRRVKGRQAERKDPIITRRGTEWHQEQAPKLYRTTEAQKGKDIGQIVPPTWRIFLAPFRSSNRHSFSSASEAEEGPSEGEVQERGMDIHIDVPFLGSPRMSFRKTKMSNRHGKVALHDACCLFGHAYLTCSLVCTCLSTRPLFAIRTVQVWTEDARQALRGRREVRSSLLG